MSRTILTGLLPLALWLPACRDSATYACMEDADCVLTAQPGICTDVGHCAYPDAECPTGWRYPLGVDGVLSGTCAPGPAASSTTAGTDSASGGGTTTSSTSDGSTTSTSTTTGTSSSTTSSGSTTDGSTSGGSTGTTGDDTGTGSTGMSACGPDEGSSLPVAETVPYDNNCESLIDGFEHDEGLDADEDWFSFSYAGDCAFVGNVDLSAPDSLDMVCAWISCGTNLTGINCNDAEPAFDNGLLGCCSTSPHSADFGIRLSADAMCDEIAPLWVQAVSVAPTMCTPYQISVAAVPD